MTAPDCPSPATCPVPDPATIDLRRLRTTTLPAGTALRTAAHEHWYPTSLFNATGTNRARFSPVPGPSGAVPTLYVAHTEAVALLESVFHDVHEIVGRVVSVPMALRQRLLVTLVAPEPIVVFDLTDPQLAHLGIGRSQLVTTTAAHYPCTAQWAAHLHGRRVGRATPTGIMWSSRIAELAADDHRLLGDLLRAEPNNLAVVLFGDRLPTATSAWAPAVEFDDLTTGAGRHYVEAIASLIDATVVDA